MSEITGVVCQNKGIEDKKNTSKKIPYCPWGSLNSLNNILKIFTFYRYTT